MIFRIFGRFFSFLYFLKTLKNFVPRRCKNISLKMSSGLWYLKKLLSECRTMGKVISIDVFHQSWKIDIFEKNFRNSDFWATKLSSFTDFNYLDDDDDNNDDGTQTDEGVIMFSTRFITFYDMLDRFWKKKSFRDQFLYFPLILRVRKSKTQLWIPF